MKQEPDTTLSPGGEARRDFVRKAVYVPPAILTLQAAPAYAKYGSEKPGNGWGDDIHDHEKDDDKDVGKDKGKATAQSRPLAGSTIG